MWATSQVSNQFTGEKRKKIVDAFHIQKARA